MDDSGAILCQISSLKDMLDHVNEEIEANIQTTRDIESELVKCSEIESCFVMRESNLMKAICVGEYDVNSLIQVKAAGATSLELLEKELSCLRMKREEAVERMAKKREAFVIQCRNFQRDIVEGQNEELKSLLSDKDLLEIENDNLNAKNDVLRNSMSAFIEEILGELHGSNSGGSGLHHKSSFFFRSPGAMNRIALNVDILCGNLENEKLLEDIDELKTTLLAASLCWNH